MPLQKEYIIPLRLMVEDFFPFKGTCSTVPAVHFVWMEAFLLAWESWWPIVTYTLMVETVLLFHAWDWPCCSTYVNKRSMEIIVTAGCAKKPKQTSPSLMNANYLFILIFIFHLHPIIFMFHLRSPPKRKELKLPNKMNLTTYMFPSFSHAPSKANHVMF